MDARAVTSGAIGLEQTRVRDAMHEGVLSCSADTPLSAVAELMAGHGVHCVVVTEADDLGPERREPVEPHVEALLREGSEEVENRVGVRARRWPKAQGASVAEDHVDDVGHRRILPLVRRRRHDTQRRGSNGPSHG